MQSPELNGKKTKIFNHIYNFSELRNVDYGSRIGLYVSKIMLFIGLTLVFFENSGLFVENGYFGSYNWITGLIFVIGAFLSYLAIPFLYYSSFKKFKKGDEYWDQEMFWILPIFFFATFFQYGSGVYFMLVSLIMSVFIIFAIHARFMLLSKRMAVKGGDYEKHYQYFVNMEYLTAYYFLLLFLFIFFNPVQALRDWMGYDL